MNPQAIKLACILKNLKVRPAQVSKQGNSKKEFSLLLDRTLKSAKGVPSEKGHEATKRAKPERGWLEAFQNQLLSSGIPLKDLLLAREAMPGVKKLLLAEGFSEAHVNDFLEGLFGGDGRRSIKITELFEKLSQLKGWSEKESHDPVLGISVLPHLETLLRCLGMDVREVDRAISQATVRGEGLSLKSLIDNLKQIISKLPDDTRLSANQSSAEDIKGMLTRLGVMDEAVKINEPMSLERFVQMLEQKVASLMPHHLSRGQVENHVARLLDQVFVSCDRQGTRPGIELHEGKKAKGLSKDAALRQMAAAWKDAASEGKKAVSHKQMAAAWKDAASEGEKAVSHKQMAVGWKEAASEGEKAVSHKQMAVGWKEAAFEGEKAAAERDGFAGSQMKKDKSLPEVEKLVGALRKAPAQKTLDQKGGAAVHFQRETVTGQAPASETTVKQEARQIPIYVMDQVGRRMGLALKRGENQVRIQLKPPHLGSVQLDMAMKGTILKVTMVAEHHSVKALLISHVYELRQALVEQGVELQRVDVEIDHHFDQSMGSAKRDLNDAASWRRSVASASGQSAKDTGSAEELTPANVRSDSLLDMFA